MHLFGDHKGLCHLVSMGEQYHIMPFADRGSSNTKLSQTDDGSFTPKY